jgi:DNA-binding response OmpR family regulator
MHGHVQLRPRGPHRTILVVVEEPAIRELLSVNLRQAGFFPVLAANVREARRLTGEVRPDVVLIDLDSPDAAVASFATELRRVDAASAVPTVMLTARVDEACGPANEVCGATMCIRKPYVPRELVSRIVQHMRPRRPAARKRASRKPVVVGALELDLERQAATARHGGTAHSVALAPVEMKLLRCLMVHPEQTLGRAEIVQMVWGSEDSVDARTIDQYVKRLRVALAPIGAADMVATARGLGYRFEPQAVRHGTPPLKLGGA